MHNIYSFKNEFSSQDSYAEFIDSILDETIPGTFALQVKMESKDQIRDEVKE